MAISVIAKIVMIVASLITQLMIVLSQQCKQCNGKMSNTLKKKNPSSRNIVRRYWMLVYMTLSRKSNNGLIRLGIGLQAKKVSVQ